MSIETIKSRLISDMPEEELAYGEIIFNNCDCQILSQSAASIDFLVNTAESGEAIECSLAINSSADDDIAALIPTFKGKATDWNRNFYACLLQYEQELHTLDPKDKTEHKKYTRQGMINRVLGERRQKADKASYRIKWASNIYGDHVLTNENGVKYKVFLRDFENEIGYSDNWDSKLNKLGTTKHIMYAFDQLKKNKPLYKRLSKTFPFVEIYCDPLNDYAITWHYPNNLPYKEQQLISRYFKDKKHIENSDSKIKNFLDFIDEAEDFENICIRPEVREKVERAFERSMLEKLKKISTPDYSVMKAELFNYQKEGVEFVLFKKVAIIADEMGLGKTIQAAAAAVLKKQIFGFAKTLVVCPATLKSQWKKEIETFTNEKALIVSGTPAEREKQYCDNEHFFFIINYETVLRDSQAINKANMDFLILDEAQKIKNYETKTASSVKRLQAKHTLVITGTPIENRLIDIFSVISVLDPYFFGPLWEFSYRHCLFDPDKPNKINGYYDLSALNKQLSEILIRREKRNVLDELPNVQQFDIPVAIGPLQAEYHASYAKGIATILSKKFITAYDMQRMQLLLTSMRMVSDSTYLVDETTNESPKMEELESILIERLDLRNSKRKIIIFSEWIKVHKLIAQMLRKNKIGFAELSGKVPVKHRGELIRKFENNPDCKVFLSTEAGGAGLNLQVADTLINFELPWNPAKKNQRIGRIDRLGQMSKNLTIYNLITINSIEQQIAAGLLVKQNLFEGVLDNDSKTDYVDFSSKGRSQFIEQLEAFLAQSTSVPSEAGTLHETLDDALDDTLESEDVFTEALEKESSEKEVAPIDTADRSGTSSGSKHQRNEKTAELEHVMESGMQFLSGLFKMSTGKELMPDGGQIKINQETGEVTMTFKLPM